MLEELQRRNYATATREYYLRTLTRFARYFRRPPDQLTPQHVRTYQTYLLHEQRLHPRSVRREIAALRFLYVKTLRRRYLIEDTVSEGPAATADGPHTGRSSEADCISAHTDRARDADGAVFHRHAQRAAARR